MKWTKQIAWVWLAVFVLLPACEDPVAPPVPPQTSSSFRNLSAKWHVLNNVEVSYNKRRIDRYDELMDASFTFFLSPGDVGGDIPEQWDRPTELLYNGRLFDPNYSGAHRCKSIKLDLTLPDGPNDIAWVERPQGGGETWYATTVYYQFEFDTEPDTRFQSAPGSKAQFTVRNAGTEEAPQWRLVELRDLAGDSASLRAGSTESSSWGAVKALYR